MAVALAAVVLVLSRPVGHLALTAWRDRDVIVPVPAGYVDDVSRMNRTKVAEVWNMPPNSEEAERQLRELLLRARAAGLHVSIAGARHSMGGQTIAPDGISIKMLSFKAMSLDAAGETVRVQAGAKWADVIPYLDQRGRSIEVMQSDNSFSVGGSLSVNCHGWQYGRPPIASTVESFHLMKADGTVVRCSRSDNKELFSLALGGYGLFGIILDADLRVVRNERLRLEQYLVPIDRALQSFEARLRAKPGARMVYARLNITPQRMFEDVLVNMFYPDPGPIPNLLGGEGRAVARAVFRGSAGSAYGKELRWSAETKLQRYLAGKIFSRNQLMNDSAEWFLDRSAATTDVLHEYFLPRATSREFLLTARSIIRKHNADLLNVTVRDVNTDSDTFLSYAHGPVLAFVMFFSQPRTAPGDLHMQEMTRELVDAALRGQGSYYLPYRLHASDSQFRRAYPQADDFFRFKKQYDPGELFVNQFYLKYGKGNAD